MIELKAPMSIKNEYVLELYDKDNKLKDKAYAYNLVTDYFWKGAFSSGWKPFSAMFIGTGTGTPSTADVNLFKKLALAFTTRTSVNYAYPTSTATYTATFPADASYTGTITEVGFNSSSYSSALQTHALLQDSEGNPITINKTDTDTLIVTAKVHCTVSSSEELELVPASSFVGFTKTLAQGSNNLQPDTVYLAANSVEPTKSYIGATSFGSGAFSTRCFSTSTTRIGKDNGNNMYANCIYIDKFGKVFLPNESIFPAYELQPILVGTGDGTTTKFACPIPDFVENTEVITVDGIELTRGVDYTVDPFGNSILNASSICAYSNFAKSVSASLSNTTNYDFYQFGIRCSTKRGLIIGSANKPMTFDLGSEKTCNAIYIDSLVVCYDSPSTAQACTVYLEYSDDGLAWSSAASIDTNSIRAASLSNLPSQYKNILTKFDQVTARYWRIYVSSSSSYINGYGLGSGGGNSFFGYVGDGIVFNEPPAEGAEIKIKATVNRPYKTSDYLIDWRVSAYF